MPPVHNFNWISNRSRTRLCDNRCTSDVRRALNLRNMKPFTTLIALTAVLLVVGCSSNKTGLESIFNGQDLSGWKSNNAVCWQVKDGILHAVNDPEQKGDILQTEKAYKNFVFQADFKFGEGRIDTGIFLRDTKVPHPGRDSSKSLRRGRLEHDQGASDRQHLHYLAQWNGNHDL